MSAVPVEVRPWPDAPAKYATRPQRRRRNSLDSVDRVATAMGYHLLPWQRQVIEVATEHRVRTGVPYRGTVVVTAPRQQGKSLLISAVAVEAMLSHPDSLGVIVAQTRIAAANRIRDIAHDLERSRLDPDARYYRGIGNERIEFTNGSRLAVMAPTAVSAHGESIDLAILDEAWAIDPIVLSGVVPAMTARRRSQLWVISTMGDDESDLLNGLVEKARADLNGDIAFLEWSMPEDAHVYEQDRWHEWMPALGYTVDPARILAAKPTMSLPEFRRAYGNIPTLQSDAAAIPHDWWAEAENHDHYPEVGLSIAVDVNRNPAGWSIAASWPTADGHYHVDVVEHGHGLELMWIPGKLRDLAERFRPAAIGLDPVGPAGALLPDFEALARDYAIPLTVFNGRGRANADMLTFELLRDHRLTHSGGIQLDTAAQGAHAEEKGDLWYFSRKRSYVDISPLVAVSSAVWLAREHATLAPTYRIY